MSGFFSLPLELLIMICSHLTIGEYRRIMMSSKESNLPRAATLTWEKYMESALLMIVPFVEDMKPNLVFLNEMRLRLLIDHEQFGLLLNLLNSGKFYDHMKQKLFEYACLKNGVDVVKELLNSPHVNPIVNDNNPLTVAVYYGNLEVVKTLIADPRVVLNEGLLTKAFRLKKKDYTVFKLLLLHLDPSFNDNSPFRFAARRGNTEICKILLGDPRVDPTVKNNCAVRQAAAGGYVECVQFLLTDPRIDPTELNNLALRQARKNGHTKVVEILLADERVLAVENKINSTSGAQT
ncbi:ankyrin repeat-containing domain protein [Globomyces pollinis-pini]|nr:ankyrin repeat-containing domain protein [Globomyces pollinis-pini]KAJ2993086.1 hypothetical protein HDV02_002650 [Globomyces sp. JEL0801]